MILSHTPKHSQRSPAPGTTHLSDRDKLKFRREREDTEQLYLTESWLQQLAVCCHGIICDIVMAGNPSKVCYLGNNK